MKRVMVLHGPNLDLLGIRQPEVYGTASLDQLLEQIIAWGHELDLQITHFQSNHEGELIDRIHTARQEVEGIVINAGAFTHYSYAIYDALTAVMVPAVEVHISNIKRREGWRRRSVIAPAAVMSIHGRGLAGYRWALLHLHHRLAVPPEPTSYGRFPDQIGDLRRPPSVDNPPLAVLIHGGLWEEPWTRDTTEGWAVELARRGVASVNLEYRRVGAGGGWPESFHDVKAGYEAAVALDRIDPSRVVVAGHSAGATMALWLAGEQLTVPPRVVVSAAGITDLVRAREEDLGGGTVSSLLGQRPLQPEAISPLHRAPTGVATRLISCLDDHLVDPGYAHAYRQRAGTEAELVELAATHMAVIDPGDAAFAATVEAMVT
ncbi:MAG TPA: type II 3-dehydroquinate dehydratase [Acidimicrobiia bacterium]|nr:type II 3-dehydroquinate dehydratase [Acidimicrobiia bacterium]